MIGTSYSIHANLVSQLRPKARYFRSYKLHKQEPSHTCPSKKNPAAMHVPAQPQTSNPKRLSKAITLKCSICGCVMFHDDDGYDSRYDDDDDDKFLRHDLVVFYPVVFRWLQQDPVVAVFGWYPVSRGAEVKYLLDG